MRSAVLSATPQTPITPTATIVSTPWAPSTHYAPGVYVTLGNGTYLCLIDHTSTAIFTVDLTMGFWAQESPPSAIYGCAGSQYASGWAYQFPLPADCLLLVELNQDEFRPQTEYEIQGITLYTDDSTAVMRYIALITDTTQYDSMFTGALSLRLGASIATDLRKDGGQMAASLLMLYNRALSEARTQDGNEQKWKRYSPVQDSMWVRSRYYSTNG